MPFDESKDKTLFSERVEGEVTDVLVELKSYDGGEAKVQLSRQNKEDKFYRLGRMTLSEAVEVAAAIKLIEDGIINEEIEAPVGPDKSASEKSGKKKKAAKKPKKKKGWQPNLNSKKGPNPNSKKGERKEGED